MLGSNEFTDILVLSPEFHRVALIDVYKSLMWTVRYDRAGDFELNLPLVGKQDYYLRPGYYLRIPDCERCMMIETREQSFDDTGVNLKITGRSFEAVFDRRVVWQQTQLQDVAWICIKRLIDENIIAPTDPERKIKEISYKIPTDPRVTTPRVDTQFTGDSVYDAVCKLAQSVNMGWKLISPNWDGSFQFQLFVGENRTTSQNVLPYVRFSPQFENLKSGTMLNSNKPFKTVALVGGEGEGDARRYVSVKRDAPGQINIDRREVFVDARDVSSQFNGTTIPPDQYNAALIQRGKESLTTNDFVALFDGKADPNSIYTFGRDFNIGDIVMFNDEWGDKADMRVTEFIRSYTATGISQYPTFENMKKGGAQWP